MGDDAKQPHIIETVASSGYRMIAPVERSLESRLPDKLQSPAGFPAGRRRTLLAIGVAVVMVAIILAIAFRRGAVEVQPNVPRPIAVLPLQNTSTAKDLDFLRLGLADDIATTLSYYPALSIRPFATTSKYAGPDVDLQKAAQEMRVVDIVTGHFVVAGDEVEVTLEAVDAANDRVLWRDTQRGTAHDLTGIQQQIAARVQHGLIAALGVSGGSDASSNISHNAEAYELYLRAVAEGNSSGSQIENGIRLLQRAVGLDPGYASAWAALGHLYYYQSGAGDDAKAIRLRAKAALQRAVALDPNRIDAASDLINMESEEGDLNRAYDDIASLLRRRPDSGAAHLVRSYVLWYAGLLDEAASECEKTRSLDAGTKDLASCYYVFVALGRYERAEEYLQLMSGSEYQRSGEVEILLREDKQDEALQELKSLPATASYGRQLLEPCLQHRPRSEAEAIAVQQLGKEVMAQDDPGPKYLLAGWYALCDQPDLAYVALRRAISQDYCAYPQMETDPLLAKIRDMPAFAETRLLGIACQQHFLEHKNKTDSK